MSDIMFEVPSDDGINRYHNKEVYNRFKEPKIIHESKRKQKKLKKI